MKKNRRRAKYENYYDELRKLGILKPETKDNEENKEKDYNNLTKSQIRKMLEEKGIETTDKLKKDELIALLSNSEKMKDNEEDKKDENQNVNDKITEENIEQDNEEETIEDLEIEEEE